MCATFPSAFGALRGDLGGSGAPHLGAGAGLSPGLFIARNARAVSQHVCVPRRRGSVTPDSPAGTVTVTVAVTVTASPALGSPEPGSPAWPRGGPALGIEVRRSRAVPGHLLPALGARPRCCRWLRVAAGPSLCWQRGEKGKNKKTQTPAWGKRSSRGDAERQHPGTPGRSVGALHSGGWCPLLRRWLALARSLGERGRGWGRGGTPAFPADTGHGGGTSAAARCQPPAGKC